MATSPAAPQVGQPSASAMNVALCRAIAAHDPHPTMKGPDYLAEIFLSEEAQKSLKNAAARPAIMQRLGAVSPGGYEYFFARTAYFDNVVQQALLDRIDQLVILGAGYDTRPYRFHDILEHTRVFELDNGPSQQHKRELLQKAHVEIPEQITYVSLDFTDGNLERSLVAAGFSPRKRSLFLWEGVTYYLPPTTVDGMFRLIQRNAPAGSLLSFDYMVTDLSGYGAKQSREAMRAMYTAEPLHFDLDQAQIGKFLAERGFTLLEHIDAHEMEKRYLTLPDGTLAGQALALFCLVKAEVSA